MALSVRVYIALLVLIGVMRLLEVVVSRRNQRRMKSQGISKIYEPSFRWMVVLHVAILVGAGLEVLFLNRPFIPPLAAGMVSLVAATFALRWWVIRTLAQHWNVQVMASTNLGVVVSGPYRWIRHPNYVAVFVEMLAIPMIHTAWLTAVVGALLHAVVLRKRVEVEERVLLASPEYIRLMSVKPRFIPAIGKGR